VLTVHPSLPARTPSKLVAYAKANPGKVNYGFVPGTVGQMTAEMFARSAGIELTRITYKGNGLEARPRRPEKKSAQACSLNRQRCNHHRRMVGCMRPELGEFIQ
jgi:hypothetical protein